MPARLASVVERSSGLRVVLYRAAGTTGGLFREVRRARLRVAVVVLACDSRVVGVAAQTVSAARMAIRILRENILKR
ncbi:MAG TPA: hypothetical protein VGN73_08095 [Gemmatimonadaceae bacterium]|nr:hypothetical protein [Gemmatimonadaceae bacterium]